MLKICNVTKQYETADGIITALNNISLEIKTGEFIAIVGDSGSGKTTLLNIIAGLEMPDSGEIWMDQIELTKLSLNQRAIMRRREMGIIYQSYNLIPELNLMDNILLPIMLDKRDVDKTRLKTIIQHIGLEGRERSYPNMLSGGEQQRVAIARALLYIPHLLLADEPTGNLDDRNSKEILELIKNMHELHQTTLLVTTHSKMIANAADKIIVLSKGSIKAER